MVGRGLALGALMLGLPGLALGQAAPDAQELLDRVQRLQDELAAPAAARLPAEQVAAEIGRRLGVEVLSVEAVEADGAPRYAVKVMNPPGDYNGAFLVSTLLVDAVSGEVLGEAASAGGLAPRVPDGAAESGLEARRRTYR